MSRARYWVFGVTLAAATAALAALPVAGDMAHCAAVVAADARLACYDELARAMARQPVAVAPPVRAPTATAMPTATAAATAAEPAPPASPGAAPAAPAAAASPPSDADRVRDFGFSFDRSHPAPKGPPSIQARIASIAENRTGGAQLVLDNGQAWTFTDNDGRVSAGDAITIKRASLGSFIMTAPSNHTYHVHRIQ
ncbi:MAG: hypothetical protein ABJC66_13665 [Gammaproteobacteria bacterium]